MSTIARQKTNKKEEIIPCDIEKINSVKPKTKTCCACPQEKAKKGVGNFYVSYSKLHADGLVPICKQCIQNMCYIQEKDDIDIDKFKSVLRQIDRPFISLIFQSSINQYNDTYSGKNVPIRNRLKIISYYMKNISSLRQYVSMNWEDGVKWEEKQTNPIKVFTNLETDYENQTLNNISEILVYSEKWRGNYSKSDLAYLDNYYLGLDRDYKIITENHRDYAKKIAKASLQMDKCFEDMMSGTNGAEVRYKNARETFDALCKSAKFSESTRSLNDVGISSFSVICDRVESHNWIPEHIPIEKDDIDKMLDALATINKSI